MLDAILRIYHLEISLQSRATFLAFFIRYGAHTSESFNESDGVCTSFVLFYLFSENLSSCFYTIFFIVTTNFGTHTFTVVVLTLIDIPF